MLHQRWDNIATLYILKTRKLDSVDMLYIHLWRSATHLTQFAKRCVDTTDFYSYANGDECLCFVISGTLSRVHWHQWVCHSLCLCVVGTQARTCRYCLVIPWCNYCKAGEAGGTLWVTTCQTSSCSCGIFFRQLLPSIILYVENEFMSGVLFWSFTQKVKPYLCFD